uniref:Uncharacterized protein n=1 Tax=Anguilla anguilla TaxID=7936 RepID=A0A0E9RKC8_ANGAN
MSMVSPLSSYSIYAVIDFILIKGGAEPGI